MRLKSPTFYRIHRYNQKNGASAFAAGTACSTLTWLLSDHLGGTSVMADASGNLVGSLRYTAFGEVRYSQSPAEGAPYFKNRS